MAPTLDPAVVDAASPTAAQPVAAPPQAPRDHTRTWATFAILLFAFLLYAPSLGNDFVWDDARAATGGGGGKRNPLVAEIGSLDTYLLGNWWPQSNPGCQTYRPLTTFWFALRHALFGDDARIAHMQSVLLHVLCTGLCLRLLLALGAGFTAAAVGALAFAAHAVHSESVTNIVGQAELLAFAAGVGGTLCALRGVGAGRHAGRWAILAALLFTASFGCKESALAWVGFAPLCIAAARQARGQSLRAGRPWALVAAVLLVPAIVFLLLRSRMLAHLPQDLGLTWLDNPLRHVDTCTRLCTAMLVWGYGLLLTLLPLRLHADYGPAQLPLVSGVATLWFVGTLLAAAVLALVAWQVVRGFRTRPLLALAGAVFLGFSFVVSNVPMPAFMLFAERTYFTPTLAIALAVAWLLDRTPPLSRYRLPVVLGIGAWIGASALVAWDRNAFWCDDNTVVARGVVESPRSVRLQLCAGVLAKKRDDDQAARRHFETAAVLDPQAPQPWLELARLALRQGEREQATQLLARALRGHAADVHKHERELRALEARIAAAAPR